MRNFEVKLGLSQLVVLVGVLSGTMVCVFYLGFFSGRRAGFESAMDSTASNFVKLPISADNELLDDDTSAAEVYAKLGTEGRSPRAAVANNGKGETLPDLESIKSPDVAPIAEIAMDESKAAKAARAVAESDGKQIQQASVDSEADQDILTVGEVLDDAAQSARASLRSVASAESERTTLGSLVREPVSADKKAAVAEKPESESVKAKNEIPSPAAALSKSKPKVLAEESPIKAVKAPAATQRPAANEPRVTKSMPKGWFAQVGNPEKYEDAQKLAKKLKETGFPVIIENARVRGEAYYRILVGPEDTRQRAERLLAQLRREPGLPGDPILRMVK